MVRDAPLRDAPHHEGLPRHTAQFYLKTAADGIRCTNAETASALPDIAGTAQ
jgi:hypothetical protein